MANEQNLRPIPFNQRTEEEHKKIASMGGSVKSPAKKFAAQLRELKKKGNTDELNSWFLERLQDPDANMFHLQKMFDQLCQVTPIEKSRPLLETGINLHKAHHGEKIKQEAQVVNLNLDFDVLQFETLALKYSQGEGKIVEMSEEVKEELPKET